MLKPESWKINNHSVNSRNCDSLSWILGAISLEPWFRKSQKFQKDSKNLKKLQVFIETWYQNLGKHSITSKSYAVTYKQTLEEGKWLLRLEKPKHWQKISRLKKIAGCIETWIMTMSKIKIVIFFKKNWYFKNLQNIGKFLKACRIRGEKVQNLFLSLEWC